MAEPLGEKPEPLDDPVPIFGSWPRIYLAVVLNAVLWMSLIALFQHWRY
jgi:hypothetical protein